MKLGQDNPKESTVELRGHGEHQINLNAYLPHSVQESWSSLKEQKPVQAEQMNSLDAWHLCIFSEVWDKKFM
ncbi:hypothetical protein [Oryza sativa Japonica Group]|uniref:Uncharacterized protein n=2 Tax=Oryza sativa subsp. japonica TaxID=39947 RepID=Q5NB50_ORYSJ|nr:hypothetical protein [Oryza sativa Japonica Group]BAD81459.1 hypothetical protein [Oryza sativa Japonica Group]